MHSIDIVHHIRLVIDNVKISVNAQLESDWSLLCSEPTDRNLQKYDSRLNEIYSRIITLRDVIVGDMKYLYGEWGDERPDKIQILLWQHSHNSSPPNIEEAFIKELKRLKCLESNLRTIGFTLSSAGATPDMVFNRTRRKYYLNQPSVYSSFADIKEC